MCPSTPKVRSPKPAPIQPPVAPTQAPEVNVGAKTGGPTKRKKVGRSELTSGSASGNPSS